MELENDKMINIVEEVRSGFPYYQWVINYQTEVQVNGVTHSLYLLNKNYQSISNAPLIANGAWTLIPTLV
ncbi:hypothetical protein IMX26_10455 [Clostridium sp. 'deep sea']|nr:hypothetical protein IMX26_10455 [Clostridium sp. 'deep sea']